MIPPFAKLGADGEPCAHYCLPCGAYRPAADFYTKSIQLKKRRCRACCQKGALAHHKKATATLAARLLRRIRARDQKKFGASSARGRLEQADVETILAIWNRQSALDRGDEQADEQTLAIVALDNAKPIELGNAVLVTQREAQRVNVAEPSRRWIQFGDGVEAALRERATTLCM